MAQDEDTFKNNFSDDKRKDESLSACQKLLSVPISSPSDKRKLNDHDRHKFCKYDKKENVLMGFISLNDLRKFNSYVL